MIIRNVTAEALGWAIRQVNSYYMGNVLMDSEKVGRTREGGDRWKVSLRMKPREERAECAKCGRLKIHTVHRTDAECKRECTDELGVACRYMHHRFRKAFNRAGEMKNYSGGRYIGRCCYHVHGVFFDALPITLHGRDVRIDTSLGKFSPSDEWRGWSYARDNGRMRDRCDCIGEMQLPAMRDIERFPCPVEQVWKKMGVTEAERQRVG